MLPQGDLLPHVVSEIWGSKVSVLVALEQFDGFLQRWAPVTSKSNEETLTFVV